MGLDFETRGGVAYLTMNRPEVHNALDLAMLEALDAAWQRIEEDDAIRVAVLTGAGDRAFSAGADLKNFAPEGTEIALTYPAFYPQVTKPVVAAVNGLALGGGTELLGLTDLRVAAAHATFSLTEAKVGLFPAGGSVVRFARQLPWPLAMELLVTGRHVGAEEALRWGLVNKVVDKEDLMEAAEEYAQMVLRCSPTSVRAIKSCAADTLGLTLEEAFKAQMPYLERAVHSPDSTEGMRAFAERREPKWRTT